MISCQNVVKHFYVYSHRTVSLREWFIRSIKRLPIHSHHAEFSLRDFTLTVKRGESVALIGHNGCGKSTALRLMAGIYEASAGSVITRGRIAAVIELGAGLDKELTGAENVELYGAIMGLTRAEVSSRFNEIVEFSEIGDFIQMPVKYYSSGMVARLAFSVAVNLQADILLLDEVLSVGDQPFREKCLRRLQEFQENGVTMVIVSHSPELLVKLCTRAVLMDHGTIRMTGDITAVLEEYTADTDKESREPISA